MQSQHLTEKKYISLSSLQRLIKDAIVTHIEPSIWIVAEISELNTNYSGHCYLELIEKDKHSGSIIAKSKATIWANNFAMLRPYFESATGQRLQAGINVMVKVAVDYHPVYGLSINIRDIDPVYTLGELQRQRMAILEQLEREGIIDMNAELEMPKVIQSIAVISSATAAGYGDFMQQMRGNKYGKLVNIELFAAVMQGDTAPNSIIDQLDRIFDIYTRFDAVIIIRGGGAATDLLCFDHYLLASHIAQFPLPVITGIGHDRDKTIADRVAHTSLKTPTAVAEFIIGINTEYGTALHELCSRMQSAVNALVRNRYSELEQKALLLPRTVLSGVHKQNMRLEYSRNLFAQKIDNYIVAENRHISHILDKMAYSIDRDRESRKNELQNAEKRVSLSIGKLLERKSGETAKYSEQMASSIAAMLNKENHRLDIFSEQAKQLDPTEQLKRGYTMTFADGKRIRSIRDISVGSFISTAFADGTVESKVTSIVERTKS